MSNTFFEVCMQNDPDALPPIRLRPNRTRLVGMNNRRPYNEQENVNANDAAINDVAMQPTVTMHSVASPNTPSVAGTHSWNAGGNENDLSTPRQDVSRQPTSALHNGQSQFRPLHPASSQPGFSDGDISTQRTRHLMHLSGMMRAVRAPQNGVHGHTTSVSNAAVADLEEGYWPHGIQRTGPFPVVNLYGAE
ncbi:MAG TPA: hypothetical protein VJ761_17890, partial [Ktedonobacteraceae bacterium]|nr:hypothetical protein [Ktedonobacteraceae bacterium]